ncbi:MAG: sulfatase-like hydrolase/transferase [Isosphaeraceae bacterium]
MSLRVRKVVLMVVAMAGSAAQVAAQVPSPRSTSASARPNIVFIVGEGHGWSSLSVPSDDTAPASKSNHVRTPNFERLAREGMRFSRFYAPSPRCTPSRAAYFTGVNPAKLGMTFVGVGRSEGGSTDPGAKLATPRPVLELPESTTTIAELLKRAGYATAHFGKWHVGRTSPARHGFDDSDGATSNGGPENVENPHPKQLFGMTDRGLAFMKRQVAARRPFYLQLSHYASRRGGDASAEAREAVKAWGSGLDERRLGEAACDFDLDLALGKLLEGINDLGVAGNTFVVFTTDHGSPGRNPPLDGGKGSVREGGLRVPLIVRGPGVAAGVCSHVPAFGADLVPTFAALARVKEALPPDVEGGSLVPLLTNQGKGTVKRPGGEPVVHFPHYDGDPLGPASALYSGSLKVIHVYETGAVRLFDVERDPGERRDLAPELPDKARQMDNALRDRLKVLGARFPTPNPTYDPKRTPATKQDRRGGARKKGRVDR